ncbi:methyltransferase domain-containing protein [Flavihumibacter profundi]|jgi:SAM-dependent methyltransferase|uniref:methyltransferase domain-containing protein n=1 Tax=Flavihumibacter profundi TaxID=2716883 RepID=UPI001CC7AEDD|nr:methyltransferase domain-containing protein [Flavihumibacter profundi]MBZ5857091.1 methyltransferase domain-containing protein [Flavihumibacter profundi]
MDQPFSQESAIDAWFGSEAQFNSLYPEDIRLMSRRQWTPLLVAKKAAAFLRTGPGIKILDIGSGVGKFCLAAAYYNPDVAFIGIEQRSYLTDHANCALEKLALKNVSFINGNFTELNFKDYQHFYFYNSFYENIAEKEQIDQDIPCSTALFEHYSHCLYKQLKEAKKGTRLVTYHSVETEIPEEYHIVQSEINDYLKFWIKV